MYFTYMRYKNIVKARKCEKKKSAKILENKDVSFLFSVTHESQINVRNKTIIEKLSIKIFYFYLIICAENRLLVESRIYKLYDMIYKFNFCWKIKITKNKKFINLKLS